MLQRGLRRISNFAGNLTTEAKLNYISEARDWVVKWEGHYITKNVQDMISSRITTTPDGLRNKIIHYGSSSLFTKPPHISNRTVVTVYHIVPGDERINRIIKGIESIDYIHTTNRFVLNTLLGKGVPGDKIRIIPSGVDLNMFKPTSDEQKYGLRWKLGIPDDAIVIGSFQKDGNGWGEGMEPKLIKAPDVFIKVVERLQRAGGNIHVLLLGAARGYVKRGLDAAGVPYTHIYEPNFLNMYKYYQLLDMYIVASRIEGVPKAILESMASRVPIISTKVGMAEELIIDGETGYLTEVDDIDALFTKAQNIIEYPMKTQSMVSYAYRIVENYSWEKVGRQYYTSLYKPLGE